MSFLCGCVNSIYRGAARYVVVGTPATTEVLKLNTYTGMTRRPFVRALYFQSAKKIIGKKSRMKLITRRIPLLDDKDDYRFFTL